MLRRAVVVLALVAASAPSAHAAGVHELVVRGSGNVYADVTFTRAVTPQFLLAYQPPTVSTKGTFAALWIHRVGDLKRHAGIVSVPAWQQPPLTWHQSPDPGLTFPAGRYRVHLVTNGRTEVRLPLAGLTRDVVPSSMAPDKGDAGVLAPMLPAPGSPVADATVPVTLTPTTLTVLYQYTELLVLPPPHVPMTWATRMCIETLAPVPCEGDLLRQPGTGGVGTGGVVTRATTGWFLWPGDPKIVAGTHPAKLHVAASLPLAEAEAFALTITP